MFCLLDWAYDDHIARKHASQFEQYKTASEKGGGNDAAIVEEGEKGTVHHKEDDRGSLNA